MLFRSIVNTEKTAGIEKLAAEAAWFEARTPWDPQWRRKDVKGVTARAVVVLDENNKVKYSQLVSEIKNEPDYDAALAALK